ncbi:hypothetical protein F53441_3070 [Fusarium austroafricanum]|uniref:Zn(2)-C6 fungal-type domain-containing protein n=1 Tax=Fusarium austroafricanum TaxID=2364996 RepID=A0A8H4P290_9HYPO|nr:hypothetical protein F53441_3070 [Fusarium austroafricanum]
MPEMTHQDLSSRLITFRASRPQRIKRNRPSISCSACRARKQKCDRQQPCSRCTRRGVADSCHFEPVARHPTSPLASGDEGRVQSELRKMHGLLQSLITQGDQDPTGIPRDKLVESMDRIQEAIADETNCSAATSSPTQQPPDLIFGYLSNATSADIMAALPSRQDTDRIIATYFKARPITVPFIHTHQFRRQYEAFWDDPVSANLLWVSIMFSILAISTGIPGSEPASNSGSYDASSFIDISARCLVSGKYNKATEFSVEALMIHLHARSCHPEDQTVDLAQLHSLTTVTPFESEMRRRVWYSIQHYDLQLALESGLPPLIYEGSYTTGSPIFATDDDFDEGTEIILPRPITEAQPIMTYVFISQLIPVLRNIVCHALGFKTCTYRDTILLKTQLEAWYASIPACLRVRSIKDTSFTDPNHTVIQRISLELVYKTAVTLLYRPFLNAISLDDSECQTALDICRQNALKSIAVYIEVDCEMQKGGRLHDDHHITPSLPINDFLITTIMSPIQFFGCPNMPPVSRNYAIKTLETAVQLWSARSYVSERALENSRLLRFALADIYMASPSLYRNPDPVLSLSHFGDSEQSQQIDFVLQSLGSAESRSEEDSLGSVGWNNTSTVDWYPMNLLLEEPDRAITEETFLGT